MVSALLLAQAGFTGVDGTKHPFADKRPAVLIFALPECPILRGYIPELQRIGKTKGVRFFLIHVDPKMDGASARSFAKDYALPFVPVLDARHILVKRFKIEAVPTAVVLDTHGQAAYVGRIDDRYPQLGVLRTPQRHDLRDALAAVLSHRSRIKRTSVVGCAIPEP